MGKRGKKVPGWATADILGTLGKDLTTKEMSEILEVPLSSLQRWLKKLDITTKSRKLDETCGPPKEILDP
jgi:hypothetical protein